MPASQLPVFLSPAPSTPKLDDGDVAPIGSCVSTDWGDTFTDDVALAVAAEADVGLALPSAAAAVLLLLLLLLLLLFSASGSSKRTFLRFFSFSCGKLKFFYMSKL